MVDNAENRKRWGKIHENRYGVSLVYFPNVETLINIRGWLDGLNIMCDGIFTWYPVIHASVIRCRSKKEPFTVKYTNLLCCNSIKNIKKEKISIIKPNIGTDGILRINFSGVKLKETTAIEKFYGGNELKYEIITAPWISLGLMNIENEKAAGYVKILEERFENGQFPRFEMIIDKLSVVYYSDILFKNHEVIKQINLI